MSRFVRSRCVVCVAAVGLCVAGGAGHLVLSDRSAVPMTGAVLTPSPADPGHVKPPELLQSALTRLHDEAVRRFLARPGNGRWRLVILPEKVQKPWEEFLSPGELDRETPVAAAKDLAKIHAESLADFQNLPKRPTPDEAVLFVEAIKRMKEKDWDVKALDLVGLVKHAEPVVYMSEKLPQMQDLGEAPTRVPDFFEHAGLEHLQKGNDFFIRERAGTIRMLGAVRATASCVRCHKSPEGTLLGAFSYTLRPAQYVEPGAKDAGQTP